MRHGKDLAWVYTFRILNRKEKNMLPNKRENLFNDISTDQVFTILSVKANDFLVSMR